MAELLGDGERARAEVGDEEGGGVVQRGLELLGCVDELEHRQHVGPRNTKVGEYRLDERAQPRDHPRAQQVFATEDELLEEVSAATDQVGRVFGDRFELLDAQPTQRPLDLGPFDVQRRELGREDRLEDAQRPLLRLALARLGDLLLDLIERGRPRERSSSIVAMSIRPVAMVEALTACSGARSDYSGSRPLECSP